MLGQPVEECVGGGAGVCLRCVTGFLREREALQPVQQVAARRCKHPVLGKMDVGINESRQHERALVVVHR